MIRALCLSASLLLPVMAPTPGAAQTTPCSEQLVRSVELRLPRLREGLDVRGLTCHGIVQIYFLLDRGPSAFGISRSDGRQAIEQVFRNEGLLR